MDRYVREAPSDTFPDAGSAVCSRAVAQVLPNDECHPPWGGVQECFDYFEPASVE